MLNTCLNLFERFFRGKRRLKKETKYKRTTVTIMFSKTLRSPKKKLFFLEKNLPVICGSISLVIMTAIPIPSTTMTGIKIFNHFLPQRNKHPNGDLLNFLCNIIISWWPIESFFSLPSSESDDVVSWSANAIACAFFINYNITRTKTKQKKPNETLQKKKWENEK